MTVLKTAYETTACKDHVMGPAIHAIQKTMIQDPIPRLDNSQDIILIDGHYDGSSGAIGVPAFGHPLAVTDHHNKKVLVVDVRAFGKWDPIKYEFKIRNQIEYNLLIHRARLTSIWMNESTTLLRDISTVPVSIYASWISEAVAKRFALDPKQQLNLAILAAVFYVSMFSDADTIDNNEKLRIATQISRAMRVSAQDVLEVMDKVPVVTNLKQFCASAEEVTGSIRMRELSTGILFAILSKTWFGTNAEENVMVALEHPPTWISILMQALTERTFKEAPISKIALRNTYRETGQTMLRAVLNLEGSVPH